VKILLYILKTHNSRKSCKLKEVNSDAPDKKTGQWRGKDRKQGSPIKGLVKRKNTPSFKKNHFLIDS